MPSGPLAVTTGSDTRSCPPTRTGCGARPGFCNADSTAGDARWLAVGGALPGRWYSTRPWGSVIAK
jgi:hypothetical protein